MVFQAIGVLLGAVIWAFLHNLFFGWLKLKNRILEIVFAIFSLIIAGSFMLKSGINFGSYLYEWVK